MTNQARNSFPSSEAFLSLPGGRFGAVLGRNSSMSELLRGASRFCLGARLRHGARASIFEFGRWKIKQAIRESMDSRGWHLKMLNT